ncbi:AI-2E family transporter [Haloplanus sp. GCM10025708]|uniref:AI-2E family transporter n=1 Tax=Haloferacaceae TaxID=1644056 RepID=UPI00361BEE13
MTRRHHVLGGVLVLLAVATAVVLADVLGTVFFAVTVAYLLSPLRTRLRARGLSPWVASAVATATAFVALLAVAAPLIVVLAVRLDALLAFITDLPETIAFDAFGFTYVATVSDVLATTRATLRVLARSFAQQVPVLALKLAVFVMAVFALLHRRREARRAVLATVPSGYHDVLWAYDRRAQSTLFAIYVLQAATALGTFVVALPVFAGFGYATPVALATVAAVLQFLPIVGPSILLLGIALYHLSVGESSMAVLILVVGGVVVAWLPDVLVRPRLARETTGLPGSLYFVGFVGGLLTFGTIGIVAGPLVIALGAETADLLADELHDVPVRED